MWADATAPGSAEFSALPDSVGIFHDLIVLPSVGHGTMPLFAALRERAWGFFRTD